MILDMLPYVGVTLLAASQMCLLVAIKRYGEAVNNLMESVRHLQKMVTEREGQ